MGSRLNRFKLERPLPIIDRIIPGDAKIVVGQQREPRRIIGRNPEFPSCPVFPEMNLDGMFKSRLNDLGPIRVCGTIMAVDGCRTHRQLRGSPLLIICLIMSAHMTHEASAASADTRL